MRMMIGITSTESVKPPDDVAAAVDVGPVTLRNACTNTTSPRMPYTTDGTPGEVADVRDQQPVQPGVARVLLQVDRGRDAERERDHGDEPDQDERPDEALPHAGAACRCGEVSLVTKSAPRVGEHGPRVLRAPRPTGPPGSAATSSSAASIRPLKIVAADVTLAAAKRRLDAGAGRRRRGRERRHQKFLRTRRTNRSLTRFSPNVIDEEQQSDEVQGGRTGSRRRRPRSSPVRTDRERGDRAGHRLAGLERVESARRLPVAPAAIATTIVSPTRAREAEDQRRPRSPRSPPGTTTRCVTVRRRAPIP